VKLRFSKNQTSSLTPLGARAGASGFVIQATHRIGRSGMATEGDACGTSLNGTRSADGCFRFPAVLERALGGHWAQGKISGQRAFCEIFSRRASLIFSQNLLRKLCMSFSFEILSEGSLVSLFGNPRWTGSGVHFACAIRDLSLFLACGSMPGENCDASGAANLMTGNGALGHYASSSWAYSCCLMNLAHIDLDVEESGSRILHLLGFSWALVDTIFCNSMVIAVKGTWFLPVRLDRWNAENRDRIRIRICGFSHSTINGFLVMGPDIRVN
jgi:hypothetical protein